MCIVENCPGNASAQKGATHFDSLFFSNLQFVSRLLLPLTHVNSRIQVHLSLPMKLIAALRRRIISPHRLWMTVWSGSTPAWADTNMPFVKFLYDMKLTQPERFPYESPSVTVFMVLTEGLICTSEPNYRVDPSMGFANGGEEDEF